MRAAKLLWLGVLALAPQPIPAQQQQPTDPAGEAASAPTQGSLELALQAWVASRAPPTGPPVCRLRHSAEKGGGQCWDGESYSTPCWQYVYIQLLVGLALLLVSAYLVDYRAVPHPTSLGSGTLSQMLGKVASGLHIADRDSKADIAFTQSVFLSHTRVEENFIRDNTDPALTHPPDCEPPINVIGMKRLGMYSYFFHTWPIPHVIVSSLGFASFAGALSTMFWLAQSFADNGGDPAWSHDLHAISRALVRAHTDFQFFPTFLLIGYLTFVVRRWVQFRESCFTIKGALHSIGLMVGGSIVDPRDRRTRRALFKVYRYLNLVQFLTLQSTTPSLRAASFADLVKLGIITPQEVRELEHARPAPRRDLVITWLLAEINGMVRRGELAKSMTESKSHIVNNLRGAAGSFILDFWRNEPDAYTSCMLLVTDALLFLAFFSISLGQTVYIHDSSVGVEATGPRCFQFWVVINVFVSFLTYRSCLGLTLLLRNPFITREHHSHWHDVIRTDSIMAGSDLTLFTQLRALFSDLSTGPEPTDRAQPTLAPARGAADDCEPIYESSARRMSSDVMTSTV